MDQNLSKWIKMNQNRSKWIKMDQKDQNGSKFSELEYYLIDFDFEQVDPFVFFFQLGKQPFVFLTNS